MPTKRHCFTLMEVVVGGFLSALLVGFLISYLIFFANAKQFLAKGRQSPFDEFYMRLAPLFLHMKERSEKSTHLPLHDFLSENERYRTMQWTSYQVADPERAFCGDVLVLLTLDRLESQVRLELVGNVADKKEPPRRLLWEEKGDLTFAYYTLARKKSEDPFKQIETTCPLEKKKDPDFVAFSLFIGDQSRQFIFLLPSSSKPSFVIEGKK